MKISSKPQKIKRVTIDLTPLEAAELSSILEFASRHLRPLVAEGRVGDAELNIAAAVAEGIDDLFGLDPDSDS